MSTRHFAFFRQDDGTCTREWSGPVPEPEIDPLLVGDARLAALNAWQQTVAPAEPGEVGLDVTFIGWPVGDFCYCVFDAVGRRLEWGPERYYIEINTTTLEIVANTQSHRPIRDAVPGQHVIDITGTCLEPYHGRIFGTVVRRGDTWGLDPVRDTDVIPATVQRQLEAARLDLNLIQTDPVHARIPVPVRADARIAAIRA